jgi:hypothetical protein
VADVLYHYTCAHSLKGIRREGKLTPNPHPLLGGLELVWLTDLDIPDIGALGLTSHIIKCRRTEYRITAGGVEALHWPEFARQLRRTTGDRQILAGVNALEGAPGVLPMHWWVSTWPVPVVLLEPVNR